MVRGAYVTMKLTGWFVLVPLSFASLVTGLIQSLGTSWGLFRHYWVVSKLVMNIMATIVLLLYMQTLGYLAALAAKTPVGDLEALRDPSPVLHGSAALMLLLVATTLSIYSRRVGRVTGRESCTSSERRSCPETSTRYVRPGLGSGQLSRRRI